MTRGIETGPKRMNQSDNLGSLASPDVQRCPIPFLNRLLAEAPVYIDPVTGMYIVSRYEDIAYVASHPEVFSNKTTVVVARTDSPVAAEVARRYRERGFAEMHTLVTNDPPEHTQYRALVDKVFTLLWLRDNEPEKYRGGRGALFTGRSDEPQVDFTF